MNGSFLWGLSRDFESLCLVTRGGIPGGKKKKGRKERKKERKMIQLPKPGKEVQSATFTSGETSPTWGRRVTVAMNCLR